MLEQRISFLVPKAEYGLCMVEEGIQALAFEHNPSTVADQFVLLVFSENNVLDRLTKDVHLDYVTFYDLLHAKYKRIIPFNPIHSF